MKQGAKGVMGKGFQPLSIYVLVGTLSCVTAVFPACSSAPDSTEQVGSVEQAVVTSTLSFSVPAGVSPQQVLISTNGRLQLDDRTTTGKAGAVAVVSNYGSGGTELGSQGAVNGKIDSASQVFLRSNAKVTGAIRTTTPVQSQPPVTVGGGTTVVPALAKDSIGWSVTFPTSNGGDVKLEDQTGKRDRTIAPGAFGVVDLKSRTTLRLSAGVYYFTSVNIEPDATISFDTSAGPVIAYVSGSMTHKGKFLFTGGASGNALFGVLGSQDIHIQAPFLGALVAPNAKVNLERSSAGIHKGQFFAKSLELFSDTTVEFAAFDWGFLSADSDCDGASDVLEANAGLNPQNPFDGSADPDHDDIRTRDELRFGGNPNDADTDHDGLRDDPDLVAQQDFDGDGRVTASDNCPDMTNPGQKDTDGDGRGDVCDSTPTGAGETSLVEWTQYRSASGDAALAPVGNFDTKRMQGDLLGMYRGDTSVLVFETPLGTMQRVDQLWHPSGAHVFATTAAEKSSFLALGYKELSAVSYFSSTAAPIGISVKVRRFSKLIGGRTTHAVGISDAEVAALTADGFTEIGSLGFAVKAEGKVTKPQIVVRYHDAGGRFRHRLSGLSEADRGSLVSDGRQFRVFSKANGWTVPLYRLTSASGAEELALSGELAGYRNQGFVSRGVLGFVYPLGTAVSSLETLGILYRVTGASKQTQYTTSWSTVGKLLANGYTASTPIGRAVMLSGNDLARDGQAVCKGAPSIVDRLTTAFPDPQARAKNFLLTLASACSLKRAVAGTGLSSGEQALHTKLANMDPLAIQTARTQGDRILAMSSADRAGLLGELASLDPGSCSGPVDYDRLGGGIRTLEGTPGGNTNGGHTGGTQRKSNVKLRAPQCQGLAYAADDPADADEASRAITAVEEIVTKSQEGFENHLPVGVINPIVYGVTLNGRGLPVGGASDQWADEHQHVGHPVLGIEEGDCSTCSAALGEACVGGTCRSYPVVDNNTDIRLSGANFWDVSTARIRLTRVTPADPTQPEISEFAITGINVPDIQSNAELEGRCDFDPVANGNVFDIGVTNGPPIDPPCTSGPGMPCLGRDRGVRPNENRLEFINALIAVDHPDEFYTLQVVNFNGSYVPRSERVPVDIDDLLDVGHTVHICTAPNCKPAPSPTEAACSIFAMPSCGGTVGGVWNTPPRSLTKCSQLKDMNGPSFECEETPSRFVSREVSELGAPIRIYVTSNPTKFVQTRLSSLRCNDETGGDALGSDEVVVKFGSATVESLKLGDIESGFGVFTADIDAGDTKNPRQLMSSVESDLGAVTNGEFFVQVGEDDDVGAAQVLVIAGMTIAMAAGGVVGAGVTGIAILVGGLSGGVAGGLSGLGIAFGAEDSSFFDPDDFIGQDGWVATSSDMVTRGLQSHSAPVDAVARLTQTPGAGKDIMGVATSGHPGVATGAYSQDADVISCSSDANCNSSRPVCYAAGCVQSTWFDQTLPVPFDPSTDAAGTAQRWNFDNDGGDGANYDIRITTAVSGKQFP